MEQTLPNGNSLFIRSECVANVYTQKGFDFINTIQCVPLQYPLKQLLANSVLTKASEQCENTFGFMMRLFLYTHGYIPQELI